MARTTPATSQHVTAASVPDQHVLAWLNDRILEPVQSEWHKLKLADLGNNRPLCGVIGPPRIHKTVSWKHYLHTQCNDVCFVAQTVSPCRSHDRGRSASSSPSPGAASPRDSWKACTRRCCGDPSIIIDQTDDIGHTLCESRLKVDDNDFKMSQC